MIPLFYLENRENRDLLIRLRRQSLYPTEVRGSFLVPILVSIPIDFQEARTAS